MNGARNLEQFSLNTNKMSGNLADFAKDILWYGDDIYVVSPADLRDEIVKNLKQVVNG